MSAGFRHRLFLLVLALSVISTGHAQSPVTGSPAAVQQQAQPAPLCDPSIIDTAFTFSNLPAGQETVSLHFQNKSDAACRLQGQAAPSFAVDGRSMQVGYCWLCDANNTSAPAPNREPGNEILLNPGGRARLDLHWSFTGDSCQWADWASVFVQWTKQFGFLFVPSGWPMHICSDVMSSGYRSEAISPASGDLRPGGLRVSVTPANVYSDEEATLHAELDGAAASETDPDGCASLYIMRQGPVVGTRFDPLRANGSVSRPSYTPEQIMEDKQRAWPSWKTDRLRRCDIAGWQTSADAVISAESLADVTHVEWRTAGAPGGHPVFYIADAHFQILDVDTLPPNWGEVVAGIRAGLSIDQANYSLGERMPLHLRWENVSAATPLGQGECSEPEPALEIQDSQHKLLETIPVQPLCSGHGWGPFSVPIGKAQRTLVELATGRPDTVHFGDLAPHLPGPGVYYLVAVWSPRVLILPDEKLEKIPHVGSGGHIGNIYATARSLPVRIELNP